MMPTRLANTRPALTVIGSGDAFNAMGRGHSCYLLEGEGVGPLMVDFGATALAGLRRGGREPTQIAAIAFTHLHGDHIGGMPYLIIDGLYNVVRSEPLEVLGPVGTSDRIDLLVRASYGDVVDDRAPFELRVREIAPGEEGALAGTTIRGYAAEHMDPPERPLCLRVTLPDGRAVAFSGDTAPCPGLFEAAAGAALLVADCSAVAPPCGRHSSWEDWSRELPGLGVPRVVLSHLGRAVRERAAELARGAPPGVEVLFAEDGLVVPV